MFARHATKGKFRSFEENYFRFERENRREHLKLSFQNTQLAYLSLGQTKWCPSES